MTAIDLFMFIALLAFIILLIYGDAILIVLMAWIQKDNDDKDSE